MADDAVPEPELSDLVEAWRVNPDAWHPRVYFFLPLSPHGRAAGKGLGPSLEMPQEEDDLWRTCAERLDKPGRCVVRLKPAGKGSGQISVVVEVSEALWRAYNPLAAAASPAPGGGVSSAAASAASPPPQPAAPTYAAPPVPVPVQTDAMGLLLTSMQHMQTMMLEMMRASMTPKVDPAVDTLRSEVQRLSKALDEAHSKPRQQEKAEREEWIELATKAATKDGGVAAAAVQLLAGPLDKLADAFSRTADQRAEIEKVRAEAERARAEAKLLEAHAASGGGEPEPQPAQEQPAPNGEDRARA